MRVLSFTLIGLMVLLVAVALYGVTTVRTDFATLAEEDLPRFDQLLHIDRDLYRAERALEVGIAATDGPTRIASLGQYRRDIEDIDRRWLAYLEVSPGEPEEVQWQREYESAYAGWNQTSAALAAAIEEGAGTSSIEARELLRSSQASFDVLRTVVHDFEVNVAEPYIERALTSVSDDADRTIAELSVVAVAGLALAGLVSRASFRAARADHYRNKKRDEVQAADARRSFFDSEFSQAMEMARSDGAAVNAASAALATEVAGRSSQLLLADSSNAHLNTAIPADLPSGSCEVHDPNDCPAVRRGAPVEFVHGKTFSACPHLRVRETEHSALCVPVSIAGKAAGVLHSVAAAGESVDEEAGYRLELVANRLGERLGVLRAFAQSETQAATDPLTGLHNRRSFENEMRTRLDRGEQIAVAYGDLDHFKKLNDMYGHAAGDRALRLFARVLSESLREVDVASRWGGEEFVVALLGLDAADGAKVLHRLRENLLVAVGGSSTPPFTVSFGITDTRASTDLDELIRIADESLNEAKQRGRDRVLVSGAWPAVEEPDASRNVRS
ncbi:MAG: diguanylate cyclase [Actinomycetota bacterium]